MAKFLDNGGYIGAGIIQYPTDQIIESTSGSSSGLYGKRYANDYADIVAFFDTASEHGDVDANRTQLSSFTSSADNYSWMWTGQFLASETGTWTFYTSSDDMSHLWVGPEAITGYTTANAIVDNGGYHGVQERSGTIALTAGEYYPIRIMFGEAGGGDAMTVNFAGPTVAKRTDGDGYFFDGAESWDAWVDGNSTFPRTVMSSPTSGIWNLGGVYNKLNVPGMPITLDGCQMYFDVSNPDSYPGSGSVIYDLSGNERNGTVVGSPTYSDYYLSTINDSNYISAAHEGSVCNGSDDYTFGGWYWFGGSGYQTTWEYGVWGDSLLFRPQNNNLMYLYTESVSRGTIAMTYVTSTWQHICHKRTSNSTTLWINGVQSGTALTDAASYSIASANIFIGRAQHAGGQHINGRFGEFHMYNRALTDAEILSNFENTRDTYGI